MDPCRDLLQLAVDDAERRTAAITDPRIDRLVRDLCETYGYGAVMDSAMRQWIHRDPVGAFIIGGCLGTARAALATPA